MNHIVVNIYLFLGAVQDIQKKKITNYYLWAGAITGAIIRIINYENRIDQLEWLTAFIPGAIILILGRITGEKIGFGDGWVIIILGNFMTILEISMLLQMAILLTGLFSIVILCGKAVSKTYQIPFLPFLWLSHLLIWRFGYV